MDRLMGIFSYLKKHDFLAVTAICIVAVVIVTIGFGIGDVVALGIKSNADQEAAQGTQPGEADVQPDVPDIFRDEALEMAVANALGVEMFELTPELLADVTSLQITDNADIASWQDINHMPNLEALSITNCEIVSVRPFAALSELKELNLSGNKISDISPLLKLEKLEKLNLSDNPISKVPDLSRMQNLMVLNLDSTSITDLMFMKGSSVSELHISYTSLPDFEVLADCEKLETLYMYGYHFMDLSPLHQLPNFHSIYLSQGFDRSQVDFLIGRFMMADKYTRIYLVLKNRGFDVYE